MFENIFLIIPHVIFTGHRIEALFARYSRNPRYVLHVTAIHDFNWRPVDERRIIADFLGYRPERSEGIEEERLKL